MAAKQKYFASTLELVNLWNTTILQEWFVSKISIQPGTNTTIPWLHQGKHSSVAAVGAISSIKLVSSLSSLTYPIIFISASNLTATGSVYSLLERSAS